MKLKSSILLSHPTKLYQVLILAPLALLLVVLLPSSALASDYTIAPLIIEHDAQARDKFQESIKITNNTDRKLRIFPAVNEITLGQEGEIKSFVPASMSDTNTSVTSWIEITRGRVEINPGETFRLPVMINIAPKAKPGDYYAFIGLVEGSNRDDIEAKVLTGTAPGVIVRLELADTSNEYLRLDTYNINRFIINEDQASVSYAVENIGDVNTVPAGEIILYNLKGQEIASVPINTEAKSVAPGETVTFESPLPDLGFMGKFKALLSMSYGSKQTATIYDTVYFSVLPLPTILMIFFVILILSMIGAWYYYRLRTKGTDFETEDDVPVFVRPGINASKKDHDIDLKN